MDTPPESETAPPERMPRKVVVAITALWVSAAATTAYTATRWLALNSEGALGDALYQYPVQSGSTAFLALFAALAAMELRLGEHRARITGIAVAVWGTIISLNLFGSGIELMAALAAYIVLLSTLFSPEAKAWCRASRRRRGART